MKAVNSRRIHVGGRQGRMDPLMSSRGQRIAFAAWPWVLLLVCIIAVVLREVA